MIDALAGDMLAAAPPDEIVCLQLATGVVVVARGLHAECLASWATKHRAGRASAPVDPVREDRAREDRVR